MDLGDKGSQAVVLDAAGEVIEERSIATTREAFERALEEYAGGAWEATRQFASHRHIWQHIHTVDKEDAMKRTTVMFDEEIYARLQELARRQGTTTSLLIREAVGTYVAESGETEGSPMEALIGIFDGPAEPLGREAEEIFGEIVLAKHERIRRDNEHR